MFLYAIQCVAVAVLPHSGMLRMKVTADVEIIIHIELFTDVTVLRCFLCVNGVVKISPSYFSVNCVASHRSCNINNDLIVPIRMTITSTEDTFRLPPDSPSSTSAAAPA